MKHSSKSIFGLVIVAGLALGPLAGCVGGYVEAGEPVYYGGEPWVQTDVIVGGGGGWYGGHRDNAYVHPDSRREPSRSAPRAEHTAPRESNSGRKSDDHHK